LGDKALETLERLAQADPANADNLRLLAITYDKQAEQYAREGKADEARAFTEKALEIKERLALADPTNADNQRLLAIAYGNPSSSVWASDREN